MLNKIIKTIDELTPKQGMNETFMREVTLYRSDEPTDTVPLIYDQCMCFMIQGKKNVHSADRTITYDPDHYLVVPTIIPFEGETVASSDGPIFGMTFSIDFVVLQGIIDRIGKDFFESSASMAPEPCAYLEVLNDDVLEPMYRLLNALKTKGDAEVLGGQILREIYYRALMGERGYILASTAYGESHTARIARALKMIHENYSHQYDVAELASFVNMSSRTFHEHFKTITSYTPVQYIKRIRLEKARQILVDQGIQASVTSHMVGYESASHFSRDFKRHFGYPPSEAKAHDNVHVLGVSR